VEPNSSNRESLTDTVAESLRSGSTTDTVPADAPITFSRTLVIRTCISGASLTSTTGMATTVRTDAPERSVAVSSTQCVDVSVSKSSHASSRRRRMPFTTISRSSVVVNENVSPWSGSDTVTVPTLAPRTFSATGSTSTRSAVGASSTSPTITVTSAVTLSPPVSVAVMLTGTEGVLS
jgi:hypothetical protein